MREFDNLYQTYDTMFSKENQAFAESTRKSCNFDAVFLFFGQTSNITHLLHAKLALIASLIPAFVNEL